jgi:F-type H+-transporting ATPase subunit b
MANSSTAATADVTQESHQGSFLSPDATLLLLTWVAFFTLLAILYKFAWKPILQALEKREHDIRQAVEHADKVKAELSNIQEKRQQILDEATSKAKEIVEQSRQAAMEAAKTIEAKTKQEAQIMLENALREIREEKERAQAHLKKEGAQIAIQLASKLIEENLDTDKNRKLVDSLIKDI